MTIMQRIRVVIASPILAIGRAMQLRSITSIGYAIDLKSSEVHYRCAN